MTGAALCGCQDERVLLESVVVRVVAGSSGLRADPPTELDDLVDAMVGLLARNSVAQARRGWWSGFSDRNATGRAIDRPGLPA
jgi:hypothetical protein